MGALLSPQTRPIRLILLLQRLAPFGALEGRAGTIAWGGIAALALVSGVLARQEGIVLAAMANGARGLKSAVTAAHRGHSAALTDRAHRWVRENSVDLSGSELWIFLHEWLRRVASPW